MTEFGFNTNFSSDRATNIILNIAKKDSDEIYIASVDSGFGVFNIITKQFVFYHPDKESDYAITAKGGANDIFKYDSNSIWFLGNDGINILNRRNNIFNFIKLPDSHHMHPHLSALSCMLQSSDKSKYYAGADYGDGIYEFDSNFKCINVYPITTNKNENTINHIHINPLNNNYILDTYFRGIFNFNPVTGAITPFFTKARKLDSLITRCDYSFVDSKNNLWCAMPRYGIICYSLVDSTVKRFQFDENNPNAVRGDIYGMMETTEGEIVIATNTNGIAILNRNDFTVDNFSVANIRGVNYILRESIVKKIVI
ncbi:MAG: hypothetical protein IPP29_18735 [Bacteroidetes bacterium]|nr:hypothetical protein [Bacteroidota bacterium]